MFELGQGAEVHGTEEEDLIATLARGRDERRLVEIEYQKEVDAQPSTRVIEAYSFERALPHWYVHTYDRTSDGERSFRLDRMRSAKLLKEKFEAREGFQPTRLRGAKSARVLYTPEIARYEIERGARKLVRPKRAARDPGRQRRVARERDPLEARRSHRARAAPSCARRIAARARELAKELGVERLRVKA